MSTETTKKKIKIDNGTEFARVYTDKEVDSKLTNKQDTLVSGTNIKTLNGQSILGSGDLPISGGESVSPTLNLMNLGEGTVRTTITEQEKLNLEKGLYNQVYYFRSNQGLDGLSIYMPSRLFSLFGSYLFSIMIAVDENNPVVNNLEFYMLTIGEKNADGEYPITIQSGKDSGLSNLSFGTNIDLYNHFIKITGTKDTTQVIARFTIQSSNNLVVDTPEKLVTLLGNEFELGCNGIYGNYNITGLKKTADGALNIIYNNGGAENLLSTTGITLTITDTVKII